MYFQVEHIEKILAGEKTATRRKWDSARMKEGNSYRVSNDLFTTREESPAYMTVTDVYPQKLGEMTEEDAQKEGGYSLPEFKSTWEDINDEWDPEEEVWVVEFIGSEADPRED